MSETVQIPKEWKKTTIGNEIEFAYGKNNRSINN